VQCRRLTTSLKQNQKQAPNSRKRFRLWSNLPQGWIDKAVKDFPNKATGGWCCSLKLAVNTSNIRSDNGILASDHYLTALFQRCYGGVAGSFLNAEKSVGGHVQKSVTFVVFNRITFLLGR